MRSVRSGPKKVSQRRAQAAWKLLLGVMLPSVCVGAFQVASAAAPELHATAHNQPAWAEQLKRQAQRRCSTSTTDPDSRRRTGATC